MSPIVVRPYRDQDEEAYNVVRSLTYNDGLPIPEERRHSRFADRYVAEQDGVVAAVLNALPMTATRGEALLQCAGIAGVAVSPDARRGGVGTAMIAQSCSQLKSKGFQLASLYAFREPFYAKSGYAVAGKRLRLTVPTHRLPDVKSDLEIRRLGPSDWRELHPCYERFAHQRSGVHIRSALMWERVLQENKPLAVYAAGSPVQAYIAVSHQVAFWCDQWLSEVAWSTAEGYRALLGIMHRIGINKTSVSWYEPGDSPFYNQYLDQGVEVRLERPVMFRVCDVPKALDALRPRGTGQVVVEVIDKQVPENSGPWQVEWEAGKVCVLPTAKGPDFTAEIGPFTQAFMGEPSVRDLARQGVISVSSAGVLEVMEGLFPPATVYCGDFF